MTTIESGDGLPAVVADTTGLPYRVRRRGLELFYYLLFSIFGLAAGAIMAVQTYQGQNNTPPLYEVGMIAWALGSLYVLAMLPRPYLIFYSDRLEKRGLTGWRTVNRSEIAGIRPSGSDRAGALFEILVRQGGRSFQLREALRKDPIVARWFRGAHDLTAEAVAADKSSLLADPRYGSTVAQREARLKQTRTIAIAFNVVCAGVGVWIYFSDGPRLAHLAAAVLAPLAAWLLVRGSDGLMVWNAAGKARPTVLGAFAPAAAAAVQAFSLHILNTQPLMATAAIGAAAAAALWAAFRSADFKWGALPGIAIFSGLAIFGLGSLADVALDASKPQMFPLMVKDRDVRGSRNRTYNIYVDRWSDQPGGQVSVPSRYYGRLSIGSTVCIFRRPGALGLGWFDVADCPAGIKSPPPPRIATTMPSPGPALPVTRKPAPASGDPFYPERAYSLGKEGRAVVRCSVIEGPRLADCHVLSETPPDFGFGAAAVRRLTGPQLPIKADELRGHTTVDVPVNFRMAN